jgi:hypothetical protein
VGLAPGFRGGGHAREPGSSGDVHRAFSSLLSSDVPLIGLFESRRGGAMERLSNRSRQVRAVDVLGGIQYNLLSVLLHMLQPAMQKKPVSFASKVNRFFTTQMLICIIAALLGAIVMKVLGF